MLKINKKSKYYYGSHTQDYYTNLGYDYHGNIFKRTLSSEMFVNSNQKSILKWLEYKIEFLIDAVKNIKLHYYFAKNKDDKNFN